MHQLLTAGTVLASYTDMPRMLEFASAALRRIPGVSRSAFVNRHNPHGLDAAVHPLYTVTAETVNRTYGHVELEVQDESMFQPYAAAVHNITGLVAMRLESAAHEREIESQIQNKTRELQKSLHAREILLKEIHHRVKNNLNVVESLLKLQFGSVADETVQKGLQDSIKRIHAMSLVHKLLYQSETMDGIDFRSFVIQIVTEIKGSLGSDRHIRILSDISDIPVSIEIAVPVSLIVNELVTNAIKYAFPDRQQGTVHIAASRTSEKARQIIVEDDGVGLPDDFSLQTVSSLGMQLVSALTEQLGGTLDVHSPPGTRFVLTLP